MKLNKKGYMLVEIILASVLAMSIAYYLLNLTYRFKDQDQDIYQSIEYNNVKNLVTKNIMNDFSGGYVSFVTSGKDSQGNDYVSFLNHCMDTRLTVQKESDGSKKIVYGEYTSGGYNTDSLSYYEKEIPDSLMVGDMIVSDNVNSLEVQIPISSIYSDEKYDIKIFASKTSRYIGGIVLNVDGKMYYNGYPENSMESSQIQFGIKVNGEDKGYVGNLCTQYREVTDWQIYGIKINGTIQTISPIDININNSNKVVYLNFSSVSGSILYQGYNIKEETISS